MSGFPITSLSGPRINQHYQSLRQGQYNALHRYAWDTCLVNLGVSTNGLNLCLAGEFQLNLWP